MSYIKVVTLIEFGVKFEKNEQAVYGILCKPWKLTIWMEKTFFIFVANYKQFFKKENISDEVFSVKTCNFKHMT